MDDRNPLSAQTTGATPVRAWRFATDSVAPTERQQAWREVMGRLRLPLAGVAAPEPFHASVSCLASPLGMDFAVISGTPQEISGRNPIGPVAVWIVVLLEGEVTFWDGETTTTLKTGDIAYGPTGIDAALKLTTPFRLLFINAPRVALDHRLLTPLALRVGRFAGERGLGHVFSGLLRGAAEALPDLTSEQLRPIELAVTEFLVANLAAEDSPAALGGAGAARAAHLHRVCQTIETLLSDPDLNLDRVAAADGISPRSLQKLFASAHQNFSTYLRTRRLERCRLDLSSPICASLSISEICFRWGFNGSAHFSRAFKERYGVSPREFRRAALGEAAEHEANRI
ncbi:AraC family transcriptional regulator [Phenylobacterium sp.]|uniref:AraC family transcriptional regulator n=1 Tax=Phenylobacterium sp. TaxID=1871053 RepID=UPI0025F38262|nr:AraC family transcriptional regulator [Phenylobacterium sp.]